MAISLRKGQTIILDNTAHDLSSITIGLGWTIKKKGFFARLISNYEFDLDAIAVMLDKNGKVANIGDNRLVGGDVIFFNNLRHNTGMVYHSGDNRVGGAGDQDDEQIVVKLETLGPQYERIVFLVCIYQGARKRQNFGAIEKAYLRVVDNTGLEITRYDLSIDASCERSRSIIFGEISRQDGGWNFRAVGEGDPTDTFVEVLKEYL